MHTWIFFNRICSFFFKLWNISDCVNGQREMGARCSRRSVCYGPFARGLASSCSFVTVHESIDLLHLFVSELIWQTQEGCKEHIIIPFLAILFPSDCISSARDTIWRDNHSTGYRIYSNYWNNNSLSNFNNSILIPGTTGYYVSRVGCIQCRPKSDAAFVASDLGLNCLLRWFVPIRRVDTVIWHVHFLTKRLSENTVCSITA